MNNNQEIVKYAQLDLLIELRRLCEKNSINYFLAGGTLIGAIRHNGFIPWDDDIDVGMLRIDYDKFISVCQMELNDDFALYDWHVDKMSPLPFLKLKILGTHYKEELSNNVKINDEIFIDIFCLDNAPDGYIKKKIQAMKNFIIKKSLLLRCGYTIDKNAMGLKKIIYFILRLISYTNTLEKWKEKYEVNATKYNNIYTKELISLGGSYSYKRELRKRSWFSKYIKHIFENEYFAVPEEYDAVLKNTYGDYMKIPPEKDQISRHGISYIDLGDYKIKSKK